MADFREKLQVSVNLKRLLTTSTCLHFGHVEIPIVNFGKMLEFNYSFEYFGRRDSNITDKMAFLKLTFQKDNQRR